MDKPQLLHHLASATRIHLIAEAKRNATRANLHKSILAAVDGGCSLAEIGTAMGIDRQTVRWHITKARQTQEQPHER